MTFPDRRFRAADPARTLPPQPDGRAEHDLTLLLATPAQSTTPPMDVPAQRRSARRTPLLVTALVAAVVVTMSVAVLAIVHPRTDIAATPNPGACPTAGQEALLCGTYRSTGGTGDLAFLATRPYTLRFTRESELTMLLEGDCDTFHPAVRITGRAFEVGKGGGTQSNCSTTAQLDHQKLADNLYAPDITYTLRGDTITFQFGSPRTTATFTRTNPQTTQPDPQPTTRTLTNTLRPARLTYPLARRCSSVLAACSRDLQSCGDRRSALR